jgi:dTDP-4-amino-4,6-dideoxygalactose transaminase
LRVVEDAAQGILAKYKDRPQGSYGDLSTLSFHETKNITSGGEGGALIINNPEFVDRAEIIREKGTNRSQFFRGMVDKYSWVDLGSSYLPSEIQAAYLWGQIQCIGEIAKSRLGVWEFYDRGLRPLAEDFGFSVPNIPVDRIHNAHMYYLKVNDLEERSALIRFLGQQGVQAVFHYVPLHSSPAGRRYSRFHGVDTYTTRESERLVRLPLWYGMREAECDYVIQSVSRFYSSRDK